jgi:hypothetical protein
VIRLALWFTGAVNTGVSEDDDGGGDETGASSGEGARVIRLQIVQESEPVTEAVREPVELLEDLRRRAALKRNGDAKSLSEALAQAGGGADRLQMQVIRERLNGLETRVADAQAMLRKQARVLRRIQMLLYATLAAAVVGTITALAATLG